HQGPATPGHEGSCHYSITSTPGPISSRFLNIVHSAYVYASAPFERRDLAAIIQFSAPGTYHWEKNYDSSPVTVASPHKRSSAPGDYLYYLKRLAKLEYIGIPQMTYEPIYCNTNYQEIVPGIFKSEIKNVHDFNNNADTFLDPNGQKPWQTDTAETSMNAEILNRPF